MSERFGFSIEFDVPYGPESLRAAFESYRCSVAWAWAEWSDDLSFPEPAMDIDAWLAHCVVDRLVARGSSEVIKEPLVVHFSPRSNWVAWLWVRRQADGNLYLHWSVSDRILFEWDSVREDHRARHDPNFVRPVYGPAEPTGPEDFERWDMEWDEWQSAPAPPEPWVVTRGCLLRIIEGLKKALPVRDCRVDEQILRASVS